MKTVQSVGKLDMNRREPSFFSDPCVSAEEYSPRINTRDNGPFKADAEALLRKIAGNLSDAMYHFSVLA